MLEEIQMKNFDMVSRRPEEEELITRMMTIHGIPLVDVNMIIPTTMKLNCWDHIVTSILKPENDNPMVRNSRVYYTDLYLAS